MPLRLRLRAHEKIAINGAVLSGSDQKTTTIIVHNHASILRGKDVILPEDANTPVRRTYYILQLMYLDHENTPTYAKDFADRVTELRGAFRIEAITEVLNAIDEQVESKKYYSALALLRPLLKYEDALLNDASSEDIQEAVAETVLRLYELREQENRARLVALDATEQAQGTDQAPPASSAAASPLDDKSSDGKA